MIMAARTIVVADDDPVIAFTVARGLRAVGFVVYEAHDGGKALQLCRENKPDIALLDIRMPGMDGIQVAERLKQETGTPFLMLTAFGDVDLVERAIGLGAYGYLVKPLKISQIVPAIEAALARAAQIGDLQASEENLVQTLQGSRDIATAVGVVMERYQVGREEAFEALRRYARSHRSQVGDVAAKLMANPDAVVLGFNGRGKRNA